MSILMFDTHNSRAKRITFYLLIFLEIIKYHKFSAICKYKCLFLVKMAHLSLIYCIVQQIVSYCFSTYRFNGEIFTSDASFNGLVICPHDAVIFVCMLFFRTGLYIHLYGMAQSVHLFFSKKHK